MFSTCPFVRPFVRLSVTNLWTLYFVKEWTDFNAKGHKFSSGAKAWTVARRGQEVKGQGHRRPKLCLKEWRRHHSRSLETSRYRRTVSDGNVAFEKGSGVLHIVLTAFVGYVSCWRTCFFHLSRETPRGERWLIVSTVPTTNLTLIQFLLGFSKNAMHCSSLLSLT